ncbi:4868_t:CDS:2 [Funneliformis mosseae]|uniref:4868_t:CDS:1 n=1 Tax=Funneliformis mosseae TaxID=27381 RepID=A0A9N9H2M0_FUNMO|nr:4868_t:CDS:2 [Funneliformis mosseae]
MGQALSSSTNNPDQDGDVIMVDDSENNTGDASDLDFGNNHTGATHAPRRRTQASRTNSQDRTQFTTSSTFEHAPQNGSPRVLRMTPARRRRQLSSLYPFFPSATTTNQTQIPLSRPLTRLQRLHHNTIEDVSLAPRQTDAIAPNLLRRSRTRSSTYNGQETSTSVGIALNDSEPAHTLPTSETMFDISRPRSSSVDAIIIGDLDSDSTRPNIRLSDRLRRSNTHRGSSTRPYSSSISLSSTSSSNSSSSTAGTQTDPLAAAPTQQRSRRRVTRISARRFFNIGGQESESNSNNNIDIDNQHLGRFLSIAAAATAASLVASQENAVIEAERAANEGHDGSFESFLAALQRRRREATNRPTNQSASSSSEEQSPSTDNNTPGSQPSQPMSFFRLFRFGGSRSSLTQQNIPPENSTDTSSSIPNATNETNTSNTNNVPHMVPVIIIGIRSVQPRDDPNVNSSSSQNVDTSPTNSEHRNNSNRSSRTRSSSTSSRASARSTASTSTQTPPARSWIIYVLGGTYPSTHPILTTPSLFSDNPTYEDMMLLSSLIGPARPATTTQSEIDANLPVAKYDERIRGVRGHDLLGNAEKCQVCLCDYITNEDVRVLICRHGFHRECIDKWLTEGSNKCPICRGVGVLPRESETNNNGAIPTTSAGLDSMGPFF